MIKGIVKVIYMLVAKLGAHNLEYEFTRRTH